MPTPTEELMVLSMPLNVASALCKAGVLGVFGLISEMQTMRLTATTPEKLAYLEEMTNDLRSLSIMMSAFSKEVAAKKKERRERGG